MKIYKCDTCKKIIPKEKWEEFKMKAKYLEFDFCNDECMDIMIEKWSKIIK